MEHPHGSKEARRERVHAAWRVFCDVIMDECGEGRERALAMTNAEQAQLWAAVSVDRTK